MSPAATLAAITVLLLCFCGTSAAIALVVLAARALRVAGRLLDAAEAALTAGQHDDPTSPAAAALDEMGDEAPNVFPLHPSRGHDAEIARLPGGQAA